MDKHRFAKSVPVAAGLMLTAVSCLSHAQTSPKTVQASNPTSSASQGEALADAFAGLTYTDEQKEVIKKIRQETASHKDAVMKDPKLNADQKDAMLSGYDRIEYGNIYKVLTPDQRKQVQLKLHPHQGADQGTQGKK